ncbi:MAG: hypothetical protein EPN23_02465 [Verrucomicrobia bacterium]|nr:MAG: hypothetical protein EPN23_02465 [Verrucomicrobiota bacterium]
MTTAQDIPILLMVFNRPDLAHRVLEQIQTARPTRLFIAADGPRPDHPDDDRNCQETRRLATQIDWPCEVKTLFRDHNLGCDAAVGSAIPWFFEHVEAGIVLEDDCLPDPSFFPFCAELLERHRDDEQIMAITGCCFQPNGFDSDSSYFFSQYPYTWGWATWRRAWKHYKQTPAEYPCLFDFEWLTNLLGSEMAARYWSNIITRCHENQTSAWDYRWIFSVWANQGLGIQPSRNLVSNIGCDARATHTKSDCAEMFNRSTQAMAFPLKHPPAVVRHVAADRVYEMRYLCPEPGSKPAPVIQRDRPLLQRVSPRPLIGKILRCIRGMHDIPRAAPLSREREEAERFLQHEFNFYRVQVQANTMAPVERQLSLYRQAVACEQNGIPGAFVECGTWKGGLVGVMALANLRHGLTRRSVHLFDSFEGIPEPDPAMDGAKAVAEAESVGCHPTGKLQAVRGFYENFASGTGTLEDNRHLLERVIGYPVEYLHYHVGWFQDTVPAAAETMGPIAILRLDGDWYASTRVCLEGLFSRLVPGGYLIIDDYGCYEGCRRATDEFFTSCGVQLPLTAIDAQAVYGVLPA